MRLAVSAVILAATADAVLAAESLRTALAIGAYGAAVGLAVPVAGA